MTSQHHNRRSSPLKAAMLAAGAATLLLTAGCGAPAAAPEATQTPATSTAAAAAAATSTPSATATATGGSNKGMKGRSSYAQRLFVDQPQLKAGDTLHVSGGLMTPGATLEVYACEQAHATYNAATGMWSGPSDDQLVKFAKANPVVDAQGHYDVDLLIPAGTAPQTMNVLVIDQGRSDSAFVNVVK